MCVMVECGFTSPMFVFVLYGWAGGSEGGEHTRKTAKLMDAVVAECEFLKGAPIVVVGDLNCCLEALPAVQMGIDANQ
eukprot:9205329-Alexandrium_andersonii.AAC.1